MTSVNDNSREVYATPGLPRLRTVQFESKVYFQNALFNSFLHFLSKHCIQYVLFSGKQWQYLSFIKIPAWLSVICLAKSAKPLYVYVHTDHLGTFDNQNARSKFPSHSSTLMKHSIRWGLSLPRK